MDKKMKNAPIAIIGGGWAGLACAVKLAAAKKHVCLFEASRQLGGRARSVSLHGHMLDNGQHILLGAYHETLHMMQMVGSSPKLTLLRLPLNLDYPGGGFRLRLPRLPAPFHLPVGLITARGCSIFAKLSAVRFMKFLRANAFELPEECSVAELLNRHRQKGRLRRFLWDPLCLAALNTAPENASAQIFSNVLRDTLGGQRGDTDLLLPHVDLNRLFPDAAAHFISAHGGEIKPSTRIERIGRTTDALTINGEAFRHIVVATAPHHAASLLENHPETETVAALLDNYPCEPIATAYIAYPKDVRLPTPMLGMDTGKGEHLGQWAFDRGQLGEAKGVISIVMSAKGTWYERDNDTLTAALHNELQKTLNRSLPQPLWHQVIREHRATFSCRPNLIRPAHRTSLRRLWLAGDYTCADYPATLEGAIRSGVDTAQEILNLES